MLYYGKSLLIPLPPTKESFDDFVPNWGNLEMFFFFFFSFFIILLLLLFYFF